MGSLEHFLTVLLTELKTEDSIKIPADWLLVVVVVITGFCKLLENITVIIMWSLPGK